MNLIRYIGDKVLKTGRPIKELSFSRYKGDLNNLIKEQPYSITEAIGARGGELASVLIEDLQERGLVRMAKDPVTFLDGKNFQNVTLSLDGWDQYEAEKRGVLSGDYGFLARKFDEPELDNFVHDVLKPTVEESTGYKLHDMNDISRAGVIDNIMRIEVRDAKFVLVDLTHDNNGAYWEAGYAEGLGKPVIYLCEKVKFEAEKTHFDTNHCTTVPWDRNDDEDFKNRLTATLSRSLNLPDNGILTMVENKE